MASYKMIRPSIVLTFLLGAGLTLNACDKKEAKKDLAPQTKALQPDDPTAQSQAFAINTSDSKITFEMDAELEHISGRAPQSASGNFSVDLSDVTKTTGLIKIDLLELSIYQQKRESADGEFGKEEKNDTQNGHMRTWLQISDDGPSDEVEKNRFVEFKISEVSVSGEKNLSKIKEKDRKVTLNISGDVRLHGRFTKHTFPAEAVFSFTGDKVSSVHIVSKKTLDISLDKHDVHPRSAFNVLADKTLEAMGSKVAKVAKISLDITAIVK